VREAARLLAGGLAAFLPAAGLADALCGRLEPVESPPSWALLVDEACGTDGARQAAPRIAGEIAGATEGERDRIRAEVAAWLSLSPGWRGEVSQDTAVSVAGDLRVSSSSRTVKASAPYRRAHDKASGYTCQPPGPPHPAKCDKPQRTSMRVTWTDLHEYAAREQTGRYELRLAVSIAFGEGAAQIPLAFTFDRDETKAVTEHDETFAPAGLKPRRASLEARSAWLDRQLAEARAAFLQHAARTWRDRHCRGDAFTLEEAARCARGSTQVPAAARRALEAATPGGASGVHELLERARGRSDLGQALARTRPSAGLP
jgi:hypothetical protein